MGSRREINRVRWTMSEVVRLRELRRSGMSIPKIAKVLNRSPGSVSSALCRDGLASPAPSWRRKPGVLWKVLAKMLNRYGVSEIADRLGISRQAIYTTIQRRRAKSSKPLKFRFYSPDAITHE